MSMDFSGINKQKLINTLMGSMAKKGVNSENLSDALASGNMNKVLGSLSPQDAEMVKRIMNDPNAMNKILSSPEAAAILKKLM